MPHELLRRRNGLGRHNYQPSGQQGGWPRQTTRRFAMAIERWRPFGALMERDPFREIQSEMNRLFDNFFGRPTSTVTGTGSRAWMPVVDMYETNDDLILDVELPGVREKEISLTITGEVLTVKGDRQFGEQLKDEHYVPTRRAAR